MTSEQLKTMVSTVASEVVASALKDAFEKRSGEENQWVKRIDDIVTASKSPPAPPTKEEKGLQAARMIRAIAAGKGDSVKAVAWAEKHYPENKALHKALSVQDSAAGGFIVPPNWRSDMIELLRPASVIRSLNPTIWPLTNGTATVPGLSGGSAASYVSENANIGKTEPKFRQLNLSAKKLAAIVPISNDLIRYSSPAADTVVRDDLVAAIATRSDLAFIRGDGLSNTPKGLLSWTIAANKISANGTVNLANVTTDLGKIMLQLLNSDSRMLRPGWIMAPRTRVYLETIRDSNGNFAFRAEMMTGRLWGMPFGTTTQVPINLGGGTDESEIYIADFADVVIGEAMDLVLDVSSEAAYYDGANVVAAFSRDQTVIRAIEQHDFGMRHVESVAILTAVKWIP